MPQHDAGLPAICSGASAAAARSCSLLTTLVLSADRPAENSGTPAPTWGSRQHAVCSTAHHSFCMLLTAYCKQMVAFLCGKISVLRTGGRRVFPLRGMQYSEGCAADAERTATSSDARSAHTTPHRQRVRELMRKSSVRTHLEHPCRRGERDRSLMMRHKSKVHTQCIRSIGKPKTSTLRP